MTLALVVSGVLLVLGAEPGAQDSNPWEEVENDDGIVVFARAVTGSSVREVRAEAAIPVPAPRVWAVLTDTSKYVEFMPYLVENRVVAKHPKGQFEYQLVDPPIVDRRDYTLRIVLEEDLATGVFRRSWSPANDRGPPPVPDVVRLQVNQGSWTVRAVDPKACQVTYYLYTDPGGNIPNWMANKANTTSVPSLMRAVRARAIDPAWRRD